MATLIDMQTQVIDGPIGRGRSGLAVAFERSQRYRPVLMWAAVIGMCLSVGSPLLWTSDLVKGLGVRGPGMAVALALPYVLCMLVGHGIYRVLVRRRRSDARVEA